MKMYHTGQRRGRGTQWLMEMAVCFRMGLREGWSRCRWSTLWCQTWWTAASRQPRPTWRQRAPTPMARRFPTQSVSTLHALYTCAVHCITVRRCVQFTAAEYLSASSLSSLKAQLKIHHTVSTLLALYTCAVHHITVHRGVQFTATEHPSASARPCLLKFSLKKHAMLFVSTLVYTVCIHSTSRYSTLLCGSLPLNIHPPLLVFVIS